MKPADFAQLVLLAALWGGSYLCLHGAAAEFGPVTLAGLRAAGAALLLLPLLARRGLLSGLHTHWRAIALTGLANSALPYLLFSYAALTLPVGQIAVFSAATPLCTALLGWVWLGERPGAARIAGLVVGLAGVFLLVQGAAAGTDARSLLPMAACLAAAGLYGFAAHYSRRNLGTVSPLLVAGGSQLWTAMFLLGPAVWAAPAHLPSARAWGALTVLVVACTACAYVLFFRLIARVGAARTVTVTFLIPLFGMLWGMLFLGETPTLRTGLATLVILLGTGLTTGVVTAAGVAALGQRLIFTSQPNRDAWLAGPRPARCRARVKTPEAAS